MEQPFAKEQKTVNGFTPETPVGVVSETRASVARQPRRATGGAAHRRHGIEFVSDTFLITGWR